MLKEQEYPTKATRDYQVVFTTYSILQSKSIGEKTRNFSIHEGKRNQKERKQVKNIDQVIELFHN